MHALLFLSALLPWANAQSTSASQGYDDPFTSPSITLQSPGNVESCDPVDIRWIAAGLTGTRTSFTINYTNEGAGGTATKVISGVAIAVTDASTQIASWKVTAPTSGYYILTGSADGVTVYESLPFMVTVSNTTCLTGRSTTASSKTPTSTPRTTTSSRTPTSLRASTTGLARTDPSVAPVSSSNNSSRVSTIVGAIFGSVIFVVLLAAFFFYRRRRSLKTRINANTKPENPKGHRRWGFLSSVDSAAAPEGTPIVPYTAPVYAGSRSESVYKPTTDDYKVEKGTPVHEEGPAGEMPTVPPRSYTRYSNGVLNAALAQQSSGLAAFNDEQAKTASLKAGSPATSLFEYPFADHTARARGARSKSLSVPSTAHPSPRSSNGQLLSLTPTHEGPCTPRTGEHGWSESLALPGATGLRRSTSANVTRPTRKPVPQYDPSIEMTTTTTGAHSSYSAQNSVTNLTADSHSALASSVDSTTPWLIDRAPVATRNIGLASQGDGPVHYLMPDMPPPPRV